MSVLWFEPGCTVKYSLSTHEIPHALPSGFPLSPGFISPYIPPLVIIQIQYWWNLSIQVCSQPARCPLGCVGNSLASVGRLQQMPIQYEEKLSTTFPSITTLVLVWKLDGVGLVDNRPSTDKLQHIVKKKIVTCDTWHVTCDMWHVTHDTWHVTQSCRRLPKFGRPPEFGSFQKIAQKIAEHFCAILKLILRPTSQSWNWVKTCNGEGENWLLTLTTFIQAKRTLSN